ncbi:unnamed protein product, partial [Ascophyllum nodosum]
MPSRLLRRAMPLLFRRRGKANGEEVPSNRRAKANGEKVLPNLPRPTLETRPRFYEEPKIILKNKSKYQVSFYVLQEDKMKVEAIKEGVQREAGTSLAIAGDGIGRLGAKALRKVDITKDLRRANQHFL